MENYREQISLNYSKAIDILQYLVFQISEKNQ